MRLNGIGTTLLGVSDMDENGVAIATMWFTFLFLPIIPLARYQVQFLPHAGSGASFDILRQDKLVFKEVLKTYLSGWILAPALILGPIILAVRQNWEKLELPEGWYTPYVIFAIAWFIVMFLVVFTRLENRCRPKKSMNIRRILERPDQTAAEEGRATALEGAPSEEVKLPEAVENPADESAADGVQATARKPGSSLGGILFVAVLVGSVALTLYWVIAQTGPALWLIRLQDRWFGAYYPFYTFLIVWVVMVVLFALAAGLVSSVVEKAQAMARDHSGESHESGRNRA